MPAPSSKECWGIQQIFYGAMWLTESELLYQEIIIHLRNELGKISMESHMQCNDFLKGIIY